MKYYAMTNGDLVKVQIQNKEFDVADFFCICIIYDNEYNMGINLDGSFFLFREKGIFKKKWVAEENKRIVDELIECGAVEPMRPHIQVLDELPEEEKPFFDFGGEDPAAEVLFPEGYNLNLWLPRDLIFCKN